MPRYITSGWRPTIDNSNTRVAFRRQMHQFHRSASHQDRWRFGETESYWLFVLSPWDWQTRCPDIAGYLGEKQHVHVFIVICGDPHDKARHCISDRREAHRAHNMENGLPKGLRFRTIWETILARLGTPFQEVPDIQSPMTGNITS